MTKRVIGLSLNVQPLFPCLFIAALLLGGGCRNASDTLNAGKIELVENGLIPQVVVAAEPLPTFSLEERMRHYNVPGVSIAVVEGGKLLWAKGYGTANEETGQPVSASTLFQAGSISKPVAALAALKLWEEGRVDLDADVNQ